MTTTHSHHPPRPTPSDPVRTRWDMDAGCGATPGVPTPSDPVRPLYKGHGGTRSAETAIITRSTTARCNRNDPGQAEQAELESVVSTPFAPTSLTCTNARPRRFGIARSVLR